MDNLRTPTDIFGENFFNKTYGDFFHEVPIFGGMWDSILVDDGEKTEAVLEFKTTKRSEDWAKDVPEYYALQAALYAYLLGVDDVIMVASFLESKDYDTPEKFKPSAKNTITVEFKVSERYPNFDMMVEKATKWWNDHVLTGISPDYDEKKDAEILKALRTNNLSPDTDIDALISEAEGLKTELDEAAAKVADKEKRLKEINDVLKEHAMTQFRDGDKKVEIKGSRYTWAVSRSETSTVDKDALKADGLLDKYTKKSTQYRMTVK
jgi:predicted phage-related endonuclease